MRKTFQKIAVGFVLAVFVSLMLTCGAELSHGTTTDQPNSLGVVISNINPNTSLVGSIVDGQIVADKDGREATAIRIHPIGMYALYDQTIAFCGDQTVKLTKPDGRVIQGDIVFIYRRQAARLIDGIPCFELKSAFPVLTDKELK